MDKFLIDDYKHTGKRKNNPDVGIVSSVTDQTDKKKKYNFDPYLDPQLNWSGKEEKNELIEYFLHLGFNSISLDLEGLISGKLTRDSKTTKKQV